MNVLNRTGAGFLGASLAAAALASPAAAQIPLNPRALGMGGAYVAVARGHESVFSNPANLGLAGSPRWSLGFPQVTAGATVLGPEVGDLRDYFNYDDLSDERRAELLAEIPAGGTALEGDVRAPLVTYQNGGFALGVAYGFLGTHTVGRDVVDLFLNGYQQGRTDYSVGDTRGSRATYWDFAAGYGRGVGPLSLGVTGHYYLGRGLVQTQAFEPTYDLASRDIRVDYVGVNSHGGSGWGLDVGAALQPVPGLTLSAAVANAVHSMEWSDELDGRRVTLTRADFFDSDFQVVRNRYEESEQELGSTPTGQFAAVAEGLLDDAELPTTLRLGAAWTLPSGTTLTGAYHDDLTEGRLAGRWSTLAGVGLQQKLPVGTVRVGWSSDLEEGSILGGGVTLGPIDLAVARLTTGSEQGDASRNGYVGSFGLSVRVP
ncbi:MAG TPA: DUF5723 family protein [Longimicrobiaceae bacterium]|jgi:hypothetical protein